uniref:Family with sequence similarity 166 member C n=1 Tax=Athene cunicularia TaxID=194338 RepID=A0A663MD44_ATHCN
MQVLKAHPKPSVFLQKHPWQHQHEIPPGPPDRASMPGPVATHPLQPGRCPIPGAGQVLPGEDTGDSGGVQAADPSPAACTQGGSPPQLHAQAAVVSGRKHLNICFCLQLSQQHREFYRDRSGTLHPIPYFVLPSQEKERFPHPLDLTPLSAKTRWHLLRVSPVNLRTYQTFPSGKRVTSQERQLRDCFFEYRA